MSDQAMKTTEGELKVKERPTIPLDKIQADREFIRKFVSRDENLNQEMASDEGMKNEDLWRHNYERYQNQEKAKGLAKELLEDELKTRLEKEWGIKFDKKELEAIFKELEAEIETLSHDDSEDGGSARIRSFVEDYQTHLENVQKTKVVQKEMDRLIEEVNLKLPAQDVVVAEAQTQIFDQYLESQKEKRLGIFKTRKTKDLEEKIKGFRKNPKKDDHDVEVEFVQKMRDRYSDVLSRYKETHDKLSQLKAKTQLKLDALSTLGDYKLIEQTKKTISAVGAKKIVEIMRPNEPQVENDPGALEKDTASKMIADVAELFTDLTKMNLDSLRGSEAEVVEIIDDANVWARKNKDVNLDEEDKKDIKNILKKASDFAKKYKLADVSPEMKAAIDTKIDEKLAKVQHIPAKPANKGPKKKFSEYLDLKSKYADYYEKRKAEFEKMLPDSRKHEAENYAIDFLKDVDDYMDEAIVGIESEVNDQLKNRIKEMKEVKVREAKPEVYTDMLKSLLKCYRLAGENEFGKKIAGDKMIEQLTALADDPQLGEGKIFVQLVLKDFKKAINK